MSTQRATIEIGQFDRLADAIRRGARFFAPVLRSDPVSRTERSVELAETTGEAGESISFDDVEMTAAAAKGVFLPQREVLLYSRGETIEPVRVAAREIVVFGVRPCDARALSCLDRVFDDPNGRFRDPYYLQRRAASVIISLSCRQPRDGCFCTVVGGGPADEEGSDLIAYRLEEKLLFEAVTRRGAEFLGRHAALLEEAAPEDGSKRDKLVRESIRLLEEERTRLASDAPGSAPAPATLAPPLVKEKLDSIFDDAVWEEITRDCLGCGACTYLCPTCHCFDITDECDGRGCGIRVRSWDSCQYPLFTLHASGHNPRVNRTQRLRQRIMHKFSYAMDTQQRLFCVGCGRCVRHCPVNLDIREAMRTLVER